MTVLLKNDETCQRAVTVGGVNVTEALRVLQQAGYTDSTVLSDEAPVILQRVIDNLCSVSLLDGLTGLANARHFRAALERETERAARTGESCALLMLDLDHFKRINDTYGHPVGDLVLQAIGKVLAKHLRPMDTVARYGGEEFAVVLPNSLLGYAVQVAERLRNCIADEQIPVGGQTVRVTVSIGVACTVRWKRPLPGQLIEAADRSLYEAKTQGRNRVWAETPTSAALSSEERTELVKLPV